MLNILYFKIKQTIIANNIIYIYIYIKSLIFQIKVMNKIDKLLKGNCSVI